MSKKASQTTQHAEPSGSQATMKEDHIRFQFWGTCAHHSLTILFLTNKSGTSWGFLLCDVFSVNSQGNSRF